MNPTRPEAETEYSTRARPSDRRPPLSRAGLGVAVAGAALLLAAEFTPLERITTVARHPVLVRTVAAGPHHGWALVPIAVLALGLTALAPRRRLTAAALALLGLTALGIAVLADLPDIHASGIVGSPATSIRAAQSRAGVGLYLETLGGALLVLGGGAAALLHAASRPANRRATHPQQTRV